MKIDLHIHTKTCSDGNLSIEDVFEEAHRRGIEFISITDHDSIDCQERAMVLASEYRMHYITGVELNVSFRLPGSKAISLDFLGYGFRIQDRSLTDKLQIMQQRREERARQILDNLNNEFDKEGLKRFTEQDMQNIQATVDGTLGRPHIANYLVEKNIVRDKQEAFDKYLVKCDVPKYPLSLAEASSLVHGAGGILVHAHPNDPHGTSLAAITRDLEEQTHIIETYMLDYIDGIECWHSRNDVKTTAHYVKFARKRRLIMTGGTDCHQKPILMGSLNIPDDVVGQFDY
ncbi:MAG: PHP domain-containing protein [Chloroflexota bacterium]|nr:PHP domain-containing protein [Chloroflexota bacterium]